MLWLAMSTDVLLKLLEAHEVLRIRLEVAQRNRRSLF
jgi:hypothetical protein